VGKSEESTHVTTPNLMAKKKKKRIWNPLKKRLTLEVPNVDIPKLQELADSDNRKLKPFLENEIKKLTKGLTD